MPIPFARIPAGIRVPGVYSEISNANATSGAQLLAYRRLLIGTKLAAGSAVANVPVQVTNTAQADGLGGVGSVIAGMAEAALAQDSFTPLFILPIADPGAGAAATATLTITGTATAAGTLSLYVAGRLVQIAVALADTPTLIGGKVTTAITAATRLPVSAGNVAGVVTFTAKNKGETGNALDVRAGYYGEVLPAGVTVAFTAFTGGTGNPDIAPALAALGDQWFQVWATAYTDTANLVLVENDQNSRWGPLREVEGHAFGALRGTLSAIGTIGLARNNEHLTLVQGSNEPMASYEKAAESASIAAFSAANDPARPIQNLNYVFCLPPIETQRFTVGERDILLRDGIATTKVTAGGVMQAERFITTYQKNSAGGTDVSYLDSETLFTLLYLRHDWKDLLLRKYPRSKLADDGNRFGAGQATVIVTPKSMKAEMVAWAVQMEARGLVENIDTFKAASFSERNISDRNRMDNLLVPDLVNQLRIIGNQILFIL
jgi:phage tail sheath gpL-like